MGTDKGNRTGSGVDPVDLWAHGMWHVASRCLRLRWKAQSRVSEAGRAAATRVAAATVAAEGGLATFGASAT